MKLKMKSSFIILFLLQLFGMSAGLREYKLIFNSMNWSEAQRYCRQEFTDLATVTSDKEQNNVLQAGINAYTFGWIGLKRSKPLSYTWHWSDGQTPTRFMWSADPTAFIITNDCAVITPWGWSIKNCSSRYYVVCYRSMNLVMENKTWEEALQYCRNQHCALASLILPSQLLLAETEAAQAQTASVWTGLRFLNRNWMWVTGENTSNIFAADSCPASRYRCGAHNFNTHVWENRDCNEKLNFLCS